MDGLWSGTTDTRLAAAFQVLGMPLKLEVIVDERNRWRDVRYHIGMSSTLYPGLSTTTIRHDLKTGQLERTQPAHPFLDSMRANRNWDRLLDAMKKGRKIGLVKHRAVDRWTYEEGEGFEGVRSYVTRTGQKGIVESGDLKMVAALGVIGFPVLEVRGSEGQRKFTLPQIGPMMDGVAQDAALLIQGFRDRTLKEREPEHPLLWAMFTLHARMRLRRFADERPPDVMVMKPGSKRAAFVRADAPNAEWDRMRRHFQV